MAERRMFAKTIIDSDAFLDMPLSTQALYFHLSMRADDEGFINNPKKIQRMTGCSDDDLKLLCAKNFIIPFESGVVVIKHWRIHNYIRADRLVATKYKEERDLLEVKDNGAYTLSGELKEIEALDSTDKRKLAYKYSSLPYSFTYKIRRAFEGRVCPICGCTMTTAYKNTMPTVQHNTPISKGGAHEIDNISVICESCNTSIRDTETGDLNNAEVIEAWDKIILAEKNKIDWFRDPNVLTKIDVCQMSDTCQSNDGIGKDSIGKDRLGKDSIKRGRFTPPTPEEVRAYATEKGYNIDADRFVDFYQMKDWMVGKNKMKDWRAAVRTWVKRDKEETKVKTAPSNSMSHSYTEDEWAELRRRAKE